VVLFDRAVFERTNGYPNCYWGWGPEDFELGQRCKFLGLNFERRDGTYKALPHKHAGFSAPGVLTEEARLTRAMFEGRRKNFTALMAEDGLNSIAFNVVEKRPLSTHGQAIRNSFHYRVDLR
jgi:predicted glycosyltransferase involved in capsule biosynthesis